MKALAITVSLAAAAIIVLGLSLSSANSQVTSLQNALSVNGQSAVLAALATPGHKVVTMKDAEHHQLAMFVVLPDGRRYLLSSKLPTPPATNTYQRWGIVNGVPVSIGVLGSSPRQVACTLASSPGLSALAVTIEPRVDPFGPRIRSSLPARCNRRHVVGNKGMYMLGLRSCRSPLDGVS